METLDRQPHTAGHALLLPDLFSGKGRLRLALSLAGWFSLTMVYFLVTDNIPTWSIDSQIIILALGFLLQGLFYSRRQALRREFGTLAYRAALLRYLLPGYALELGFLAHAGFMNGPSVPRGGWTGLLLLIGSVLLIGGVLLALRTMRSGGIGLLFSLDVYAQEPAPLLDAGVYGSLRHPMHAGLIAAGTGLALLNGNANALALIPFIPLGFFGWARLVEERELIERLGPVYRDYRRKVPAFLPRPGQIIPLLKYLFNGS